MACHYEILHTVQLQVENHAEKNALVSIYMQVSILLVYGLSVELTADSRQFSSYFGRCWCVDESSSAYVVLSGPLPLDTPVDLTMDLCIRLHTSAQP